MNRIHFMMKVWCAVLCLSVLVACQQSLPAGGTVGVRNYDDAVVHIGQVDPAYRAYFRDQNAANYSLSDQRKAYIAAVQTARTPVRASDYRPSDARSRVARTGRRSPSAHGKARVIRKNSSTGNRRSAAVRRRSKKR